MLWRFRKEVLFILGLFFSLLIIENSYVRKLRFVENDEDSEEQKINYEELIAENIRLRKILDIKTDKDYLKKFTVAEVISIRPFVFPAELIIDKGVQDGLKEGMPVLSRDQFLIGRILSTRNSTSTVVTIFNVKSKISVVTESTGEVGILEGGNVPYVSLKYIPSDSVLKKGDKVLTSGYSDFYLRGIEVGEVVRIEKSADSLFLEVYVKPYGCFSGIYEVLAGE
jgi:rod shape-determining protein MreC